MRRRVEFLACYERGRRYVTPSFLVFVLARQVGPAIPVGEDGYDGPRFGSAVSKKHGKAVRRNRVKRILREFFRTSAASLAAPLDVAVVPKRSLDPQTVTLASAGAELAPLFARILGDWERSRAKARPGRDAGTPP